MSNEIATVASELEENKELIKSLYCKDLDEVEMKHFFFVCNRMNLNPITKQIYVWKFGKKMTIIVGVDGLRLIADRTKQYAPGRETVYAYKETGKLLSATAYVKKLASDGSWHEVSAIAFYDEYFAEKNPIWKDKPHVMLAKCAESQALRRAFPAELSGTYGEEEMDKAKMDAEDKGTIPIEPIEEPKKAPELAPEMMPDFTFKKACEILAQNLRIENDALFSEYVQYGQSRMKGTFRKLIEDWSFNPEPIIKYYAKWKAKQASPSLEKTG